jgi:uncharacterized protein (DUF1810 family)
VRREVDDVPRRLVASMLRFSDRQSISSGLYRGTRIFSGGVARITTRVSHSPPCCLVTGREAPSGVAGERKGEQTPDGLGGRMRMAGVNEPTAGGDPYDLGRFVQAQRGDYEQALSEIGSGRKRSHWMWYTFPQFEGLGFSSTSQRYSVKSVAEAKAYLAHPMLGPRLVECAEAALRVEGRSAVEIFGAPDDMKLRSCATLFGFVSAEGSVFHRVIDKYFDGQPDDRTLRLIGKTREP